MISPPPPRIKPSLNTKTDYTVCFECNTIHDLTLSDEGKTKVYECSSCQQINDMIQSGDTSFNIDMWQIRCFTVCTIPFAENVVSEFSPDGEFHFPDADYYFKHREYTNLASLSHASDTKCTHPECTSTREIATIECPFCGVWSMNDIGQNGTKCYSCNKTWYYGFEYSLFCDVCNDINIHTHDEFLHCTSCSFDSCKSCVDSVATTTHPHELTITGRASSVPAIDLRLAYKRPIYKV